MSRYTISSRSFRDLVHEAGLDFVVNFVASHDTDVLITGITQDSREIQPGDLYCCIRGENFDGHNFVHDAVGAGATALLVDRDVENIAHDVCIVRVDDVRSVIGHFASAAFGHPATALTMVGVTGTNGKTSTTAMLSKILTHAGHRVHSIGTLSGVRTTPEAIDLHAQLRDCVDSGVTHVVMEVSSHALAQHRVVGVVFDVAVFTNIGRDHLDFHGTEEAYFAAKAMLFDSKQSRHGVINRDDMRGRNLLETAVIEMSSFSHDDASRVDIGIDHVSFDWQGETLTVPMGGVFTVMNALAAATTARHLGISFSDIAAGLRELPSIPGRFQAVPNDAGVGVIVDYAHTPDGLAQVLLTARSLTAGRVIVVFGCGGNRDQGKRPEMGKTAADLADVVFVTSDNPRTEQPEEIISQIVAGISDSAQAEVHEFTDRRMAITSAISMAERGDIVVLAGKGHELTQEVNGVHHAFSDVDEAHEALQKKGGTPQ